jgi:hypothetical protein
MPAATTTQLATATKAVRHHATTVTKHAALVHHTQLFSLTHVVAYAAIGSFICTYLLARATKKLANSTNELASSGDRTAEAAVKQLDELKSQTGAAQQHAAAAQEALDAATRPLLIDVPRFTMQPRALTEDERLRYRNRTHEMPPFAEEDASQILVELPSDDFPRGLLRVPVRNIGAGPAIVQAARLAQTPLDMRGDLRASGVMQSVVAPSQIVIVEFEHQEPKPGWLGQLLGSDQILVMELTYTDIAERQLTSTRLFITGNANDPARETFTVAQVEPLKPPQLFEPPSNLQVLRRKIAESPAD